MDGKTVELSIWDTAGKNMPQVVGIVYQKYADNKKKIFGRHNNRSRRI